MIRAQTGSVFSVFVCGKKKKKNGSLAEFCGNEKNLMDKEMIMTCM